MNTEQKQTPQSAEDKFFGVKTVISSDIRKTPDDDKEAGKNAAPEIEVEEEESSVSTSTDTGEKAKKQAQTPAKPAEKPAATTSDDDNDPELAEYSESVKKRIGKLTWQAREAERQAESIRKERDEAVRFAKQVTQKNQQYEEILTTGEAHLVRNIKDKAALAVQQAEAEFSIAYESGDPQKVVEAQRKLITAQAEQREAGNYENDYNRRVREYQHRMTVQRAQPQPQPQPQPQQRQAPVASERAQQWAKDNPWFHDPQHKDMTALAYGVHETLLRDEGVKPDSEEYFQRIDTVMRSRFPEHFAEEQGQAPVSTQRKQPPTVVAPASRNNGAQPRKVKLTATQARLAKRLGLTYEQYAKQLIKESNHG